MSQATPDRLDRIEKQSRQWQEQCCNWQEQRYQWQEQCCNWQEQRYQWQEQCCNWQEQRYQWQEQRHEREKNTSAATDNLKVRSR
ncbi:hypothetical protein H6G91_31760 [Nostoc muscorum FACHB-395]|nr:hypothetical protein [Desmonostoc muscorum FACHB-395]